MLSIIEQRFIELLLEIVDELIAKHRELGQVASGDWEDSLEAEVIGGIGAITGLDYTEYISSNPRKPGTLPPVDKMIQYAKDKFGLSGKAAEQAGWAIAQKIKKEGVDSYPEGTDLIDGVFTEERINKFYNDLGLFVSFIVAENLQRELQTLAV